MIREAQRLRAELEAAIETAIAVLDLLDGDPDMEPEPIEASGDEDEQPPSWAPQLVKH
jgi:hypothetical protein